MGRIAPPYWWGLYGPRRRSAMPHTKLPSLLAAGTVFT